MAIEFTAEPVSRPADRPRPALAILEGRPNRRLHSRSLGHDYHAFLAATGISSVGDGLVRVALPLVAASITRNGLAVGGVLVALRLPWLAALPLGAFADRTDRRRLAVSVALVQAAVLLAAGVAVATGARSLLGLYVLAFVMGLLEATFTASTSAVVPAMVAKRNLVRANGHLEAARFSGDNFAGQSVGALLFVAAASLPFLFDGVSFVAAALILFVALPVKGLAARRELRASEAARPLREDVADGIRYLRRRSELLALVFGISGLAFCGAMVLSILVLYVTGPLHLPTAAFGLFMAVGAVGAVLGGLFANRLDQRLGHARLIAVAVSVIPVCYLALAAAPSVAVAGAAVLVEGFAVSVVNAASAAIRQERVPLDMLGRVYCTWRMFVYGAVPLGAMAGGIATEVWSLRGAILLAGVIELGMLAVGGRRVIQRLESPYIDLGSHSPETHPALTTV